MKTEIEVKFLADHDEMRHKLTELGGKCVKPMRLMRRVVIDPPGVLDRSGWLRVRDEGDKVTLTYKQCSEQAVDGVKEIEITVSDFSKAIEILNLAGLPYRSYQESKREDWELDGAEIMLDEWPWLKTGIEIEAKSEAEVRKVAAKLGLDWEEVIYSSWSEAYRRQYPHLPPDHDSIGDVPEVKFGAPLPEILKP